MIEQLKTIRDLFHGLDMDNALTEGGDVRALEIYDALTQLEAMVGEQEPVAKLHDDGYWTPMKTDAGRALNEHLMHAGSPSIEVYTAAPVAQQTVTNDEQASAYMDARLWEFIDMAGAWPTAKPDPRIWAHVMVYAPVAQQPQARPDFTDEWTGYLKDGETPFERFLRERKDMQSVLKLYQRVLEENERLKGQQPQAEAVPPSNCRQRLAHEGKAYPRSSCAACGAFSPKWKECDAAIAAAPQPKGGE